MPDSRRITVIILTLLFILGGGALFGESWSDRLEDVFASSPIPSAEQELINERLLRAEESDIPAELLVPRVEEGIAKHVPPARIISALDREANALEHARSIMISSVGEEDAAGMLRDNALWMRTATLSLQGVADRQLEELLAVFFNQDSDEKWTNYRYGTNLYSALITWGMGEEESMQIVRAAAASSIPGSDYRGFLDLIVAGVSRRVSPARMTQRIREAAPRAASIDELRMQVLY